MRVLSSTFALSIEQSRLSRFKASSKPTRAIRSTSGVVYNRVLKPLFPPPGISSTPRGSPKYIPPVNSRTINMSRPETTSCFKLDASAKASKTIAGLKFANNPSSFLIARSPASGRISKSTLSHLGPPTAPNKTASACLAFSMVSDLRGSP